MWHSYWCHLSFIGPDSMGRLLRTSFFLVFQNHGSLWTGTPSQFVPMGLLGPLVLWGAALCCQGVGEREGTVEVLKKLQRVIH